MALVVHHKPHMGFWDAVRVAFGWKSIPYVEYPHHGAEAHTAVNSIQYQRIAELERECQQTKSKLDLTSQLLTQYKASLDRSTKAIESLEVQLKTQQQLIFNLMQNFHKDQCAQDEKFKVELEKHAQTFRLKDEERESQITFLFNKLFALESSFKSGKKTESGVGLSSNLNTAQSQDSAHSTASRPQEQVLKDDTQVDVDAQLQSQSPVNPATFPDQHPGTIYAILDGDGHIFNRTLLRRGAQGGIEAAKLLMDSLASYYRQILIMSSFSDVQIRVNIFLNSRGLQHILATKDVCTATQYDNFMAGFTQSNPKILICDVRPGKDAADMKVREHLLDYARSRTVTKIFFGGGHDQGYSATLEALKREGLLSKVILIQGYKHIHKKITSFHLPAFFIPGLFMDEPFPRSPKSSMGPLEANEDKTANLVSVYGKSKADETSGVFIDETKQRKISPPTFASVLPPAVSSSSHKPVDNKGRDLPDETGDDKRGTSGRPCDNCDDRPGLVYPNLIYQTMVLANRPKHQGAPPPCYYFYVANQCPAGDKCKMGHFYLLGPEELRHLRNEGAKRPCLAIQKNLLCSFGLNCPMAHKCPHGPECQQYRQQGRRGCQFKGVNMHK